MKIQIAGTGCAKCGKLAQNVQSAVSELKLDCTVEKVEDMDQIVALGVMITPALVVDGNVVSSGKVLSKEEIVKYLSPPAGDCRCGCFCGGMAEESSAPESGSCSCNCGGTMKKVFIVLLLLFALVSIAYVVYREVAGKESVAPAQAPAAVAQKADPLTVYYFHGAKRCMTCNKIEELTRQAVAGKFAKELADGSVLFASVNVENKDNEHFIRDFDLTVRSVVMSKNGKFEKFDEVWSLVGDPAKFTAYIQDGAVKIMEEK